MYYARPGDVNPCAIISLILLPFIGAWICFGTASSEQQPSDVRNVSTFFGMLLLPIGVIVIIAAIIVMASKHSKKGQVKLKAVTKTQAGTAGSVSRSRKWSAASKFLMSISNKPEFKKMCLAEIAELEPLRKILGIKDDPTMHVAFTTGLTSDPAMEWDQCNGQSFGGFLDSTWFNGFSIRLYKIVPGKVCKVCGALIQDSTDAYCGMCGTKL